MLGRISFGLGVKTHELLLRLDRGNSLPGLGFFGHPQSGLAAVYLHQSVTNFKMINKENFWQQSEARTLSKVRVGRSIRLARSNSPSRFPREIPFTGRG